jgi:hypothetical protein
MFSSPFKRFLPPLQAIWVNYGYLNDVAEQARATVGISQERRGVFGEDVCRLLEIVPTVDCDSYEAWCQHYAWACCETAAAKRGRETSYPHAYGGVARAWHQAHARGLTVSQTPGIGWIMMRTRDARHRSRVLMGGTAPGHCGIVVSFDKEGGVTIDGNTNLEGSATGGSTGPNPFSLSDPRLLGFVRPGLK